MGVKLVSLAVAALAAALLAGCNDVGLRALYMSPDRNGVRNEDSFASDAPEIFMIAKISVAVEHVDLTARIKATSIGGLEAGTVMWSAEQGASKGQSDVSFELSKLPSGWPVGELTGEVVYDGEVLDEAPFEITAASK